MATFGTMFKTVCSFTGFTAKREEVELIAVVVLAVRAYSVKVFVHGCEGLRFRWGRGGGGGSHGGRLVEVFYEYTIVAVSGCVGSSAVAMRWQMEGLVSVASRMYEKALIGLNR